MKTVYSIFLILLSCSIVFGQKNVELEDIWLSGDLYPQTIQGFVNLNDGKSYCQLDRNKNGDIEVNAYEYESGKKINTIISSKIIAEANGLESFSFSNFTFNKDESLALLENERQGIYRHSYKAKYYLWKKTDNSIEPISNEKIQYATLNPTSNKIAYVFENNLFIKDLEKGKTKQITKDGEINKIINGAVDWVYEEEFSMSRGFEWNSDGTQLAYYKFDESEVKEWTMPYYNGLYPYQYKFKYPKAGERNSKVYVHIYDVEKNKDKQLELGSENDQYLPRIKWTNNKDQLSVQRLNRLQNHWELIMANAKTGDSKVVYDEQHKAYVDITDDIYFLESKDLMILKSERDGHTHLYLHKIDGPQIYQITKGDYDVDEVLSLDESNGLIFYTSSEVSPTERHIYSVSIEGKNKKKLSEKPGWHSAKFSKDSKLFMHIYKSVSTPHQYSIKNNKGEIIREVLSNDELISSLGEYNISETEFDVFVSEYNYKHHYFMIKPKDFDINKKYPLLMYVYGGPGSQTVKNDWGWSNYLWYQMLANKYGYIIVSVDNRGTGARGQDFKKLTYGQLGKYETQDQVAAAKYFGQLNYIDENRIGIWGWSYGGYMSSLCLFKGNDVFKSAIAVAPVTNWRFYDNIYTERYMGLPKDNAEGYDNNSPINFVDSLKGKYLLIHGTGDDNVHFQNTVEMVDALIKANKSFDSEFYPDKAHGISGGITRFHLYHRMTNFILDNL